MLRHLDVLRIGLVATDTMDKLGPLLPALIILVPLLVGWLLKVRARAKITVKKAIPDRPQIVGEARKIQWRQDVTGFGATQSSIAVCTFRIERFGEQDKPLQPVLIEIRSQSGFAGDLSEGDKVSLYDEKRAPDGGLVTSAVRNLDTGGVFGAKQKVDDGLIDVPPAA